MKNYKSDQEIEHEIQERVKSIEALQGVANEFVRCAKFVEVEQFRLKIELIELRDQLKLKSIDELDKLI